jgi:hypothetical protein
MQVLELFQSEILEPQHLKFANYQSAKLPQAAPQQNEGGNLQNTLPLQDIRVANLNEERERRVREKREREREREERERK